MIIDLTVLFDNYPAEEGFETGWGYSCFVKKGYGGILFDTGADGGKLLRNLKKAEIKPDRILRVVISHSHKDHSGGLKEIAAINNKAEIYVGASQYEEIKNFLPSSRIHQVDSEPLEIMNGVYLTGELGEQIKEISLIMDTGGGLVVVTGCAHPGIKEIIDKAHKIANDKIFAVVGGLHLKDKKENEIAHLIEFLKNEGVKYIAPSHCTGDLARAMFKQAFGKSFIEAGAGSHIYIGGSCDYV
ncbi:MBL fold metallo-hydrolase [Thermodesulfovibrio sp. 3907-1M]|uniref:MBL fold metallo-hydrolase n=1 Tax=Thermodesulfovibrio autotrophicus TaxID=3118333 RepID=A0AAU8GTJ7_9BACT